MEGYSLPANAIIEAANLIKKRGSRTVLCIDALSIAGGSLVAVVGPNGSGKSTLARILAGVDPNFQGSVRIGGRNPIEQRDRVVYLPQGTVTSPLLTGWETVQFYSRLGGMSFSAIRPRVQMLFERFGLAGDANRLVRTYSGGMRRKLDLIVTLLADDKDIFVLDEPTTGVDPESRSKFLDILHREYAGRTRVLITHYPTEGELADSVIFLANGRVVAWGTPTALKQQYVPGLVVEVRTPYPPADLRNYLSSFGLTYPFPDGFRVIPRGRMEATEIARQVEETYSRHPLEVSVVKPMLDDIYAILAVTANPEDTEQATARSG